MTPAVLVAAAAPASAETMGCNPDLWLYRDRTVGLLKRYLRYSVEVGRLPSLLGREFFGRGLLRITQGQGARTGSAPRFFGATRLRGECNETSEAKTLGKDSKPAFIEEKWIAKAGGPGKTPAGDRGLSRWAGGRNGRNCDRRS